MFNHKGMIVFVCERRVSIIAARMSHTLAGMPQDGDAADTKRTRCNATVFQNGGETVNNGQEKKTKQKKRYNPNLNNEVNGYCGLGSGTLSGWMYRPGTEERLSPDSAEKK